MRLGCLQRIQLRTRLGWQWHLREVPPSHRSAGVQILCRKRCRSKRGIMLVQVNRDPRVWRLGQLYQSLQVP